MTTEERILLAAEKEFTQLGFAATTMRAIADKAEINKGLLHYYFKTKDTLFQKVFVNAFKQLMSAITLAFEKEGAFSGKIDAFIDIYTQFLKDHPLIPLFIIQESNKGKQPMMEIIQSMESPPHLLFIQAAKRAQQKGEINGNINPTDLFLNMLSMMVFPAISKPIISEMMRLNESEFEHMLAQRAGSVKSFIKQAIQP